MASSRENPLFQMVRREPALAVDAIATIDDPTIVDASRRTLLHVAVVSEHLPAIEASLDRGIDANAQDADGRTALHYAATQRNPSICDLLLRRGASVDVLDRHENSPLWCAAFSARGSYEVVRVLMRKATSDDVRRKNRAGKSPLDFAEQIGDAGLIQALAAG